MDEGIDTGPIIFQKEVNFSESENTFAKTYQRLNLEMERLFIENMDSILSRNWVLFPQDETQATFHKKKDLPAGVNWEDDIEQTLRRLLFSA
jgi:methionyl-tRNA formyltransferase